MRLLRLALALTLAAPVDAFACTLCGSPQAISVRARLLQPDLWFNLFAVALPLVLLGLVVAFARRDPVGRP